MTTTTATPAPSSRWTIDAAHSSVGFSVRHMMITNVRGNFNKFAGAVTFERDAPDATQVTATIAVASIDTREAQRDGHLRSADFFDAEQHPTITFASKQVTRSGDGYTVTGDLTIHGVTREVVLAVDDVTPELRDMQGKRRFGAAARTRIRRSEFGMTWNAALELGGMLVSDEVTITIEVSMVEEET